MSDGILPLDAEKLLHARVPGFHQAAKIDGQHAYVERLNDVLAEILKPRNLQRLLLKRAVKLRVIERHREVAGNGLHQFDVIAGEKIPVDRLAQPKNRYSMFANAAGNEIIQVQLAQRLTDRIADVSRRTGRLKEERPADELGPGRLEETQIPRLGEPHTPGTREAHLARLQRVFHEDGQTVDQQSLRNTI